MLRLLSTPQPNDSEHSSELRHHSSRPYGEVLHLVKHACKVSNISGTDAEDRSEWSGRSWGPHLYKEVSQVKPWCGPKSWEKAGVKGQLGCHVVHQPNQGIPPAAYIYAFNIEVIVFNMPGNPLPLTGYG
ncbi:hypothetical protein H112_05741 [Trichophyton rubrum D6]|uniref:Uncharacterized protein n=4 Tax=Trichophyton TaxID=5550 RepID=F2SKA3_TRIRC|nr:uncharacterized protein TERG_03456 [Trichophyton rubrum CBS 118892]EZF16298.1 hypothetical protein H100_05758 [Trichophyton rubrum MR850]EZF40434.1 hypothetical protein H102_05726 [Trichophyton rubrum CBS 100081]EZF50942.1 hypothetical protein H103_05754 [Trichophyton rubrum CBS 288.86]EZF61657.1 hypothetical protein H104_05738 [Trichophyton rubrum CBS 289.86]EZF72046.1 hypothetical protein H105_05767 [Trichophyton soudanense CBS 452.61]EZF82768.1 hypothetical protein H110_05747 [Trichophy